MIGTLTTDSIPTDNVTEEVMDGTTTLSLDFKCWCTNLLAWCVLFLVSQYNMSMQQNCIYRQSNMRLARSKASMEKKDKDYYEILQFLHLED